MLFTSRKTGFKSWLDTLLSVELLQLFLIAFPTASQYLVDRSRKFLSPWWLSDNWWIDRASVLAFDGLFLDTSRYLYLSTTISSIPTLIISSIPFNTYIEWDLLRTYIFVLRDPILISLIFLDLSASFHLLNTISLTPNLFLCDFSRFSSLGKLLISHSSCISCFEN